MKSNEKTTRPSGTKYFIQDDPLGIATSDEYITSSDTGIIIKRCCQRRPMPRKATTQGTDDRPRRGSPEQTRERLITAAADQFNHFGYRGVDSNGIAKVAGYATGTFYKHFRDKREIFLTVYERWVTAEWKGISDALSQMRNAPETARLLVELSIKFHTEWRGLRASLMELVFSDAEARRFFRKQRRRQLDLMFELRKRFDLPSRTREQDAIHLYMTERVFDAIGQGEIHSLGLDNDAVIGLMVHKVRRLLERGIA